MFKITDAESFDRPIVCTPGVCSGAPCIEGTRLTCQDLVNVMAAGMLKDYGWPAFNADTIHNCVDYCASRQCLEDGPLSFCGHCALDLRSVEDTGWLEDSQRFIDEESLGVWRLAQEIQRQNYQVPDGLAPEFWEFADAHFREDVRESERLWKQHQREFTEDGVRFSPADKRDPTTGLYNRECAMDLLGLLNRGEYEGFVLRVNLRADRDDAVQIEIARALEQMCPRASFLYLSDSCEFGIVWPYSELAEVQALARAISALSREETPITVEIAEFGVN